MKFSECFEIKLAIAPAFMTGLWKRFCISVATYLIENTRLTGTKRLTNSKREYWRCTECQPCYYCQVLGMSPFKPVVTICWVSEII